MSVDPALRERVTKAFADRFGKALSLLVQAPGRVNLVGEHTDYNDGFVLPCAIDRHTLVASRASGGRTVNVIAADYGGAIDSFDLDAPITRRADAPWANFVRGVAATLLAEGHALCGADLAIAGDIPQGAGLSSSASLEVATAMTLTRLAGIETAPTDLARAAQRAENEFVGCACGIMDQLASACGEADHALLIDCRSLDARPVPIPDGLALLIVHSGVERGLAGSAYNERRRQCEDAAHHYGVAALRDLTIDDLGARSAGLDPLAFRRARHVVTENRRTTDMASALAAGDLAAISALMAASHASMRDDFEITVPPVDELVDIITAALGGAGGVRMTGGGFGGCVVALLPRSRIGAARDAVEASYDPPNGQPARIYLCRPSASASPSG